MKYAVFTVGLPELTPDEAIAILSDLAERWQVGMCLVDGEGTAVDLLWKQPFGSREEAELFFARAR